jgi:hypothetical protein
MKVTVKFEAYATPAQVVENLSAMSSANGISNHRLWADNNGGSNTYLFQADISDQGAGEFDAHMQRVETQFNGILQIHEIRYYKELPLGNVESNHQIKDEAPKKLSRMDRIRMKLDDLKQDDSNVYPMW